MNYRSKVLSYINEIIFIYIFVAECSPGTYSSLDLCIPCDIGFYQPRSSQSECISCARDLITYGRGAVLSAECCKTDFQKIKSKEDL